MADDRQSVEYFVQSYFNLKSRLGRIEIQVRSNLDRDEFLALYLVRRTNFWVSLLQKRYFSAILQIHFGVLLDTAPVSGSGLPIHNLWFGPSLAQDLSDRRFLSRRGGGRDTASLSRISINGEAKLY